MGDFSLASANTTDTGFSALLAAISDVLKVVDISTLIEKISQIKQSEGEPSHQDNIAYIIISEVCSTIGISYDSLKNSRKKLGGKRVFAVGLVIHCLKSHYKEEMSYEEISQKYLNNMFSKPNMSKYARRFIDLNEKVPDDKKAMQIINSINEKIKQYEKCSKD